MIAIINMNMGNLLSIGNALRRIGIASAEVTQTAALREAKGVILPGVGAFGAAMSNLRALGLVEPLQQLARDGQTPILGICLGMQLLADESEEYGLHRGLGFIPGRVVRLLEDETRSRVPNVGWCRTSFTKPSSLFSSTSGSASFYYVHSFHLETASADQVIATTLLGHRKIVSAVEHHNISGVQFHPEKSQDDGLDLLANWARAKGITN